MHATRTTARTFAALAAAACVLAPAAGASAQQLERDHFTISNDEVQEVCGLTVREQFDAEGSYVVTIGGRDQLPRWGQILRFTDVFTNTANGKTFTEYADFRNQDLQVVDNGDGTLTIHEKGVGPLRVVGSDGRLLFVDTTALWWDFTVDANGTPLDPSDDIFLSQTDFTKVAGHVVTQGRDFCDDLTSEIG